MTKSHIYINFWKDKFWLSIQKLKSALSISSIKGKRRLLFTNIIYEVFLLQEG